MLSRADQASPLLITADRIVYYGEITGRSAVIGAALRRLGLARGDRVAVLLPNAMEWFLVAACCSRLGLAIVALNTRVGAKEAGDIISRTRCTAIFLDPTVRGGAVVKTLQAVDPAALASVKHTIACAGHGEPINASIAAVSLADLGAGTQTMAEDEDGSGDPFLMIATTGTTGLPKIVVHVQKRVAHHAGDIVAACRLHRHSRVLLALPVIGGFGFTIAVTAIAAGCPIVLFEGFDPGEVAEAIRRHEVTHMFGTNDMLARLLEQRPEQRPFPSLSMYGHANFTPNLTKLPAEAERRGVRICGMYGLSETMAFIAAQPLDGPIEQRLEGGGRMICLTASFRVRDTENGALLGPGAAGELEVLTPDVMTGYLDDQQRTAEAFTEDGYLRTGDLVTAQTDGTFVFLARKGDILRIGGYLVSPSEIEDVIAAAGPIETCQVVAAKLQNAVRPVAFIVPKAGATVSLDALNAACVASLAVYKRPIRIFTLEQIPVSVGPNGTKVQKHVLRDMAMALLDQQAVAE